MSIEEHRAAAMLRADRELHLGFPMEVGITLDRPGVKISVVIDEEDEDGRKLNPQWRMTYQEAMEFARQIVLACQLAYFDAGDDELDEQPPRAEPDETGPHPLTEEQDWAQLNDITGEWLDAGMPVALSPSVMRQIGVQCGRDMLHFVEAVGLHQLAQIHAVDRPGVFDEWVRAREAAQDVE